MCLFSLHIQECNYFLSHYNCNPLPLQFFPPPPGQQWWFLTSCHLIITSCSISVFPFIIQVFLPSFLTVRWAFHVLAHVIQIFILHLHFFFSWVVISHYSTFNFMLMFFYLNTFSLDILLFLRHDFSCTGMRVLLNFLQLLLHRQ